MRVVVTGATGSIGGATAAALAGSGHEVIGIDRRPPDQAVPWDVVVGDLRDRELVAGALGGADAVVHLGAIPSPEGLPADEVFATNAHSAFVVLDEAGRAGVARAVVASSASAIGMAWSPRELEPAYLPVDERHPDLMADPYGLSKRVTELIAQTAHRQWGLSSVVLRFAFVGAGERLRDHLREFAEHPGRFRRELWGWLHRDDAVAAVTAALVQPWSGCHVLNVAAEEIGLAQPTALVVAEHFPGAELRRELRGREGLLDTSAAHELLGFRAATTLAAALRSTSSAE